MMQRYRVMGRTKYADGDYVLHADAERALGELRALVETMTKALKLAQPVLDEELQTLCEERKSIAKTEYALAVVDAALLAAERRPAPEEGVLCSYAGCGRRVAHRFGELRAQNESLRKALGKAVNELCSGESYCGVQWHKDARALLAAERRPAPEQKRRNVANEEVVLCDCGGCEKPFAYRIKGFNLCAEHRGSVEKILELIESAKSFEQKEKSYEHDHD